MSMRLIKAQDIIQLQNSPSLGRLKSKSLTYQIDLDSSLAKSIISSLHSNSSIRSEKTSGKIIIHLHLGGIRALEFEDVELLKPSNSLK